MGSEKCEAVGVVSIERKLSPVRPDNELSAAARSCPVGQLGTTDEGSKTYFRSPGPKVEVSAGSAESVLKKKISARRASAEQAQGEQKFCCRVQIGFC